MTVALFGTFDVRNYGDALFPLLTRRRLQALGEDLVLVSPVGGQPYLDALPSLGLEEFLRSAPDLRAVLLGGGNILHASPLTDVYAGTASPGAAAYPSLWLGAVACARAQGAPLLWNGPGIPVPLSPLAGGHLAHVARKADYVSVRDPGSREFLMATGISGDEPGTCDVHVVPDPAFELPRLFAPDALEATFRQVCTSRGRDPDARWVALHASPRRPQDTPSAVAEAFDAIARRLEAAPLLLDIGPCHGDGRFLSEVAALMHEPAMVVEEPQRLQVVAACIHGSSAWLGASMHGTITAAAYGVPFLHVPPSADHKHRDLMGLLHSPGRLQSSWKAALNWLGRSALTTSRAMPHIQEQLVGGVDAHWDRLLHLLRTPCAPASRPWPTSAASILPPGLLLEMLDTAMANRRGPPRRAHALRDAGRTAAGKTPIGRTDRPEETAAR